MQNILSNWSLEYISFMILTYCVHKEAGIYQMYI